MLVATAADGAENGSRAAGQRSSVASEVTVTQEIGSVGDAGAVVGAVVAAPGAAVTVGGFHGNVYAWSAPAPVDEQALASAQALLATLPIGTIPDLAPLPYGSRLPYARNPLFVGREQDLLQLARCLKPGGTAAIGQIAAATGLGGIGKTQLAVEFARRYGQFFAGGVFWISMADSESVRTEVALCGGAGGMNLRPDFGDRPLDEQVAAVLSSWRSPLPRLLVFDNCESEELLQQWRPPDGGCRVLVTSRRPDWDPTLGVVEVPLGVLSREESVTLLVRFRPDLVLGDPALAAIAEELGDLPLALHMAGSYLRSYRSSPLGVPGALLAKLQKPDMLENSALRESVSSISPTGHENHVARTFALSFEQLDTSRSVDAQAVRALARAVCFAPGLPIPRGVLMASLGVSGEGESTELAEHGVLQLQRLGLVGVDAAGSVQVHRLVVRFVCGTVEDSLARRDVEKALGDWATAHNLAGLPGPLLDWQYQLRWVAERAVDTNSTNAGFLWNALGLHLGLAADGQASLAAFEHALAVLEATVGPADLATAAVLNNLAGALWDLGDLQGARVALEQALAIDQAVLGPNHPTVASDFNSLGAVQHAHGDLTGAKVALERALAIDEAALGPNHPDVARDVNNLGMVLSDQGDLAGARAALERALAIDEAALGPNHPTTATALTNLSVVLQAQGDLAGAKVAVERALAIDEAALGPNHPDVARDVNNLGMVLSAQGDLAGARAALERALAINEAALGPNHHRGAGSLNNLGTVLSDQGDLAGARAALERALAIDEAALGPNHPTTATALNSLSVVLHAQGDLAGARAALERALAIDEAALGPNHPTMATALSNLSVVLDAQGDLAGARAALERALAIDEAALGPNHPTTQVVRSNLLGMSKP